MNTVNNENTEIFSIYKKLKEMRLSGMADSLMKQCEDPNSGLHTFEERIMEVVNAEWETRYNRKLNKYIDKANLKYKSASLDDSLYDADRQMDYDTINRLAVCEWIDMHKNLIITGKSSTGKTYLSNALCICAARQFRTVLYRRANKLLHELKTAELENNYLPVLNKYAAVDLLVIDDFALMSLDIDMCRNLFEVLDARDSFKSTMIVSQTPVSSWYDLFQNNTYADAIMERLVRGAYRLELNGRNMREPR